MCNPALSILEGFDLVAPFARTMVRIRSTVPSGNAHKVWVGRVIALGTRPPRPASSPAVSARLYLDRMAELSLKQFLPSVCIKYQIVGWNSSFIAEK